MHCKPTRYHSQDEEEQLTDFMTDKYDDSTGNYTQTVLVNSKVVSTLSTKDGKAEGWGSAVECAATNCGTVPAHSKFTLQTTCFAVD
jgi:hypothetical protein